LLESQIVYLRNENTQLGGIGEFIVKYEAAMIPASEFLLYIPSQGTKTTGYLQCQA
jgi:hypothetical protein